jgi:hypothetical protein
MQLVARSRPLPLQVASGAQACQGTSSSRIVRLASPNQLFEPISDQTADRSPLNRRKDPRLAKKIDIYRQRNIGLGAHMKQCTQDHVDRTQPSLSRAAGRA